MRLLPSNFAAVVLGAFVLVLAPLALALVLAVLQLQELAAASRASSVRAQEHGAQARAAREALVGVERALRQAPVLGVPALREAYQGQRVRLLEAMRSLGTGLDDAPALLGAVFEADERVRRPFADGQPAPALAAFDELQRAVEATAAAADRQLAAEQARLASQPQRAAGRLLWLAALAVPLAIGLALLFSWYLGRPVRELGQSMRRLGDGDLATRVVVRGPADLVRLGLRLEWLRERLATLEQTRARFLRSMSHDLKTPIASIAEGAASLEEELYGPLTPPQRSVVGVIRHNTERLLARIESLLASDRPRPAGAAQAESVGRVDLAAVVRAVLDDHALALAHRRLALTVDEQRATVAGDAEGLRVAIDNLVSNAVKFAPPGGRIELRMDVQADEVHLNVIDSGPGVAAGEEERIFDPAVRGSAALSSGAPGSGHGLAIARDMAQAHGGRLRVVDAGGRGGARFMLSLPRLLEADDAA
jgi:two-component system, NtrC family, sensor histidine kinase GlrK